MKLLPDLLLPLSLQLFFFSPPQGLDLFATIHNSFHPPDEENKLAVCSRLVVTLLDFWVCAEGGTRGREPPPPLLFLSLTTEHCSLLAHCEYFHPIRMDSNGVGGHIVAFYGPERGVGWVWGFLWLLCQGLCVHSHHLLATNTETKACRHTQATFPAMCPVHHG